MATSVTTYAALQTQIAAWMDRTDLTDQIPEFIDMVERDVNRRLTDQDMEQRAYTTMVVGQARYEMPTGALSFTNMEVVNGAARYPLLYRNPEVIDGLSNRAANGVPQWYTIAGGEFEIAPPADSAYELHIIYRKQVPSLDDTTTTNWLLEDNPDVYIFGALYFGSRFVRNGAQAAEAKQDYEQVLGDLFKQDWNSKISGGPLEMVADIRVLS